MALATLHDVKRVLGINLADGSRDIEIQQALDAVEDWVLSKLKFQYDGSPQTRTYYSVRDDERLTLPTRNVTVTAVTVDGIPISFRQEDDYVRLLGDGDWIYDEVAVAMSGIETPPASLTLGVALLAANNLDLGVSVSDAQIVSESIGDYSYSLSNARGASPEERGSAAYRLLKPYLRRGVLLV